MERYPDDPDADLRQCGLSMEKFDYEQWSPKNLFREVSDLTYSCKYMVKKNMDVEFYERQHLFKDVKLTAAEFFSMEVEGPGSEIYLRDKAFFLGEDV